MNIFYQVTTHQQFLRGLIFRIATIVHVYFAYGGKKDFKAELLKLNKSVNVVSHDFHENYKETEIFYLNTRTSVINEFNKQIRVDSFSSENVVILFYFAFFFNSLSFFLKLSLLSLTKIYLSHFSQVFESYFGKRCFVFSKY